MSTGSEAMHGSNFMDEIMKLTEEDLILTEKFLGSEYRMSKTAAYSNAGALLSSIGSKVEAMGSAFPCENKATQHIPVGVAPDNAVLNDSSSHTSDAATSRRSGCVGSHDVVDSSCPSLFHAHEYAQSNHESNNRQKDSLQKGGKTMHEKPHGSIPGSVATVPLFYAHAYGRSVPLPIPTNIETDSSRATLKVKTTGDKSGSSKSPSLVSLPAMNPPNYSTGKATTTAVSTPSGTGKADSLKEVSKAPVVGIHVRTSSKGSKANPKAAIPSNNEILGTLPPTPDLSTAPCILEATKKRSQFGFGVNHSVPSVPLPPKVNSQGQTGSNISKETVVVSIPKSAGTEGASYERKKQRAKDARVKLNESIDHLSVAMNVAGTQSKERIKVEKGWSKLPKGTSQTGDGTGNSNMIHIMEQVSRTADDAKKWDRPSFVGSAAMMVQSLNAECEILMRELVKLRKEKLQWTQSNNRTCICEKRKLDQCMDSNNISDSGSFDDADKDDDSSKRCKKRNKIMSMQDDVTIETIFQHEHIVLTFGAFLDPCSIIRTTSVSSSWQFRLSRLRSDDIWSALCYKRFGSARVREWQYLKTDDDTLGWNGIGTKSVDRDFMLDLYKDMNALNLKPKCHFEGSIYLGGGMIVNVISGWASLVERSNGETRRSVMTVTNGGEVKYASLPVVELRILIQNIGIADGTISIPDQIISIDASTKRSRGAEMFEITTDERFKKRLFNLDGTPKENAYTTSTGVKILTELRLYESTVLSAFIHTPSCPTTQKVKGKAKFVKVLVNVRGTTLPLVIPFDG